MTTMQKHPTREEILALYDYDRERGLFLRKTAFRQWQPGQIAGKLADKGRYIDFPAATGRRRVSYRSSRLVWFLETGSWPPKFMHNLDGDKHNDRFDNLLALPDSLELVTAEHLKKLFDYSPATGKLTRRFSFKVAAKGSEGVLWNNGYRMVSLNDRPIGVHRLIWRMVHGVWPENIDHINGVRDDNRIENLRNVSTHENARNVCQTRDTATGVMGVYLNKVGKPYRVRIAHEGKNLNLGCFDTLEEAKAVRDAAQALYGYHPNHGKSKADRAEST